MWTLLLDRWNSTNVHREVIKALDAELATANWKKVASGLKDFAMTLLSVS